METQVRAPSPPPHPAAGDPPPHDLPLDNAEGDNRLEHSDPAEQGSLHVKEDDSQSPGASSPCHAIFDQIVRQVEYYFSDQNLPNDTFLLNHVMKDREGYVPIAIISSFKKMKKITKDLSLIEAALRTSSLVAVSSNGKKVKRVHPLTVPDRITVPDIMAVKSRTVLVENLSEDYSLDNIQKIFETAGHIVKVTIRNPHLPEQLANLTKTDLAISSKLHALVEYDTSEAAESAVLTFNDENNWRNGMKVELLLKRMAKYGLVPKRWKNFPIEKNNGAEALENPVMRQDGSEKEVSLKEKDIDNASKGRRSKHKNSEIPLLNQDGLEKEENLKYNGRMGGGPRSKIKSRVSGNGTESLKIHMLKQDGLEKKEKDRDKGSKGTRMSVQKSRGRGHGNIFSSLSTNSTSSKSIPVPKMPDGTRGFSMGRGRPALA